MSGTKIRDVE